MGRGIQGFFSIPPCKDLESSASREPFLGFRRRGEHASPGGSPRGFAQSIDGSPHAPSLGRGDPYFLNLNQTKSSAVTNLSSQTGWRLSVHVFVFLKEIHLKGKKKSIREKLAFSNPQSGTCRCWRLTGARHPPSAPRLPQELGPAPKSTRSRGKSLSASRPPENLPPPKAIFQEEQAPSPGFSGGRSGGRAGARAGSGEGTQPSQLSQLVSRHWCASRVPHLRSPRTWLSRRLERRNGESELRDY